MKKKRWKKKIKSWLGALSLSLRGQNIHIILLFSIYVFSIHLPCAKCEMNGGEEEGRKVREIGREDYRKGGGTVKVDLLLYNKAFSCLFAPFILSYTILTCINNHILSICLVGVLVTELCSAFPIPISSILMLTTGNLNFWHSWWRRAEKHVAAYGRKTWTGGDSIYAILHSSHLACFCFSLPSLFCMLPIMLPMFYEAWPQLVPSSDHNFLLPSL